MADRIVLTESSMALSAFLKRDSDEAKALKKKVHWTQLWRYKTGRRRPDHKTAHLLAEITGGVVSDAGWWIEVGDDSGKLGAAE